MGKPKVLIVDNDSGYLESLSIGLDSYFIINAASSALDALKIMNSPDEDGPSIILLDLHMPEMTGVEFLETIRGKGNNVPILVLTCKSNYGWARRCSELSVQGYMDKLVGIEELISKMNELLM